MQQFLRQYMLPIAMVIGIVFYKQLAIFAPAIPYLLFIMLFITYSRVLLRDIRLTKFHYILLSIQYIGSILVYLLFFKFNTTLAQAAMICVLAPTAASAPVITGLLGGNISSIAAYSFISNLSIALLSPLFLAVIGDASTESISFTASVFTILKKVFPVLLLPFILALSLEKISPKLHEKIRKAQILSFYLWAIALTIVISRVTMFISIQDSTSHTLEIVIAGTTLIICLFQFWLGRRIGSKFNRTVSGGQGLGQKNTVLAIWLTQSYLNPFASIGPGAYVLWQNIVNSYQLWRKNRTVEN
ncbi:MAG: transporter [Dysgonamonadaceae bacterium]|nr:transporter [Dysgonamonadaceae bacterium]MDD4727571.1 transporter [Dysgonamonadaceae bacterium]